MKYFILLLLVSSALGLCAQQPTATNAPQPLQFTSHFYDLENHWVAFPKNEKTGKYPFGFIYVDNIAGYTFNLEGSFGIDAQGHISRDSSDYLKPATFYKYRLVTNTKLVAAIADSMLKTLGVKQVPSWLAIYHPADEDKNTVARKVLYGKHLNAAGGITQALVYLEAAYKAQPHAAGLEFELTYSYNELKQYDKAIAVLNTAIANAPDNVLFYRELGFAYINKNDIDNAIIAYTKGIDMAKPADTEAKAEMAWNMALIYRDKKNNIEEFKKWGKSAKDLAPVNSSLGQALKSMVFEE